MHRLKPLVKEGECDIWVIRFKRDFVTDTIFRLYTEFHGSKGKYTIEKENGISRGSIRNWLRIFGLEDKPFPLNMKDKVVSTGTEDVSSEEDITSLKVRIKQLESELKRAEMARDVYDCMVMLGAV